MSGDTPPQPFQALNLRHAAEMCRVYARIARKSTMADTQAMAETLEKDALAYEAEALELERQHADD